MEIKILIGTKDSNKLEVLKSYLDSNKKIYILGPSSEIAQVRPFQKENIICKEIASGCICCTMKMDLIKVLLELETTDIVFIISSGITADLEELKSIRDYIPKIEEITSILCINVIKFSSYLKIFGNQFRKQILDADEIYLNGVDKRCQQELKKINPSCKIKKNNKYTKIRLRNNKFIKKS